MKLLNKRILVCSHYSAPYAGNFIKSFLFLSKYVSEIAFVFPLETKERDWIKDIKHKVISHLLYPQKAAKNSKASYRISIPI